MHRITASLVALLITGPLVGCSSDARGDDRAGGDTGGDTGMDMASCLPVSTTPVALDEATPLDLTGAEVLDLVSGEHAASLAWAKGGGTELTLTVEHTGAGARYVDRAWNEDDSGLESLGECGDLVEVYVSIGFSTRDGAFREAWAATAVSATTASDARAARLTPPEQIAGTYQVTEVDPAAYDELALLFELSFDATGAHGHVSGQATQGPDDPADPHSAISLMAFPIASF
jgi:hypothetical protein